MTTAITQPAETRGSLETITRVASPRSYGASTFDAPRDAAQTSVLIVGAGPVGLTAAIRLREHGVDVRVVDALPVHRKGAYPALLHPRTLRILSSLGVGAALEWRGHDITRLAVYTEGEQRARLELPGAGEVGPGAMTLPEGVLHRALLRRLSELGTEVEWQTRLAALHQTAGRCQARLARVDDRDAERGWETALAEFVIGADGAASAVRDKLGIGWLPRGPRQVYVSFEAPDTRAGRVAQLVLSGGLATSIYPYQDGVSRFTFEFPAEARPELGARQLRELLCARVPWYSGELQPFAWRGDAELTPGLASSFGEGRAWLAGEAAHSTGLLGGQSLNVGIFEATDLASRILQYLGRSGAVPLGARYAEQRRLEWQRLFGVHPSEPLASHAQDWVRLRISQLLPCLPASGDDLDDLLDQLGVASA